MGKYSMANRKTAYTLGTGWAYISDMSSTNGYMGEEYVHEFGPIFFDMSSTSGSMGATYFQEFDPISFGMSQIFVMSPSAVKFQFESQFEFPDPAEHYGNAHSRAKGVKQVYKMWGMLMVPVQQLHLGYVKMRCETIKCSRKICLLYINMHQQ